MLPDTLNQAQSALRTAAPDGFYVGGCVRDWLLGRLFKDLDVAVPVARRETTDPVESLELRVERLTKAGLPLPELSTLNSQPSTSQVGRAVANALGGSFFWLREGMGVARVVVKGEPPLQIDVVPLERTLEEDLRRRDFTLNAMAVRVADGLVTGSPVIDPTGGRQDLVDRRLRPAAPDALERDPLRCLRAFRFRATLGLAFTPETEAAVRAAGAGLARVSGERIRDELFVLLESPQWVPVIADLLAYDLVAPWSAPLAASAGGLPAGIAGNLEAAVPGGDPDSAPPVGRSPAPPSGDRPTGVMLGHHLDEWLTMRAPRLPHAADLAETVDALVTPPRSRRALIRLAALAARAGPETVSIGRSLALSGEELRILSRTVGGATALRDAWPQPGRGHLRFAQQWEPGAVEAVLLTIAALLTEQTVGSSSSPSAEPTTDLEALQSLLGALLERRLRPQPPLLAGTEIMNLLNLPPGPEVGQLMQRIEERRADGLIQTPEDAREWLRARRESREE